MYHYAYHGVMSSVSGFFGGEIPKKARKKGKIPFFIIYYTANGGKSKAERTKKTNK